MTDYANFSMRARYSQLSDYSLPCPDTGAIECALTPTEVMYRRCTASPTAATMDLGDFTSITGIMVRNHSVTAGETAWITVHQGTMSPGALVAVVCANANPDTIALAGQTWVTTYGAAAGQYVRVVAATNNGTYLIQTAAEAQLTLGADEVLTAATENATLYFQSKNIVMIQPAGNMMITGDIVPGNDLIYRSTYGSPELEIFIVGT